MMSDSQAEYAINHLTSVLSDEDKAEVQQMTDDIVIYASRNKGLGYIALMKALIHAGKDMWHKESADTVVDRIIKNEGPGSSNG